MCDHPLGGIGWWVFWGGYLGSAQLDRRTGLAEKLEVFFFSRVLVVLGWVTGWTPRGRVVHGGFLGKVGGWVLVRQKAPPPLLP